MDKYFVTKNALDTRKSTAIRSSITLAGLLEFKAVHGIADTRCLIFTGRFIKDKLLHGALEAVAILRKNIPNITLLLIGEGPAENDLKVLAKDLGIDQHVRFIGPVYDEEQLAYFYSASELAVSPGYVGLMVNHAFVFGVPVVTHDDYWRHAPEVAMIEPGKSGAFFKVNSWSAMAQTIQSLLEDKHQLEDMKRYCIELIAQEYNEKHMARVFDEAVTFVLNPDYSRSAPTQPTC
jgi:glycosyltransferase involved in cell wall biosynthesis